MRFTAQNGSSLYVTQNDPSLKYSFFFFFYRFFSLNSLDFTAKDKVCIAALAVSSL